MTVSEWTREAIAARLPGDEQGDAPVRRRFHSTGSGASGRSDIAERMEELLAGLADGRDLIAEEEAREVRRTA